MFHCLLHGPRVQDHPDLVLFPLLGSYHYQYRDPSFCDKLTKVVLQFVFVMQGNGSHFLLDWGKVLVHINVDETTSQVPVLSP